MIETISKAGIAAGVDGIFLETHPEPSRAKSDGANCPSSEIRIPPVSSSTLSSEPLVINP